MTPEHKAELNDISDSFIMAGIRTLTPAAFQQQFERMSVNYSPEVRALLTALSKLRAEDRKRLIGTAQTKIEVGNTGDFLGHVIGTNTDELLNTTNTLIGGFVDLLGQTDAEHGGTRNIDKLKDRGIAPEDYEWLGSGMEPPAAEPVADGRPGKSDDEVAAEYAEFLRAKSGSRGRNANP